MCLIEDICNRAASDWCTLLKAKQSKMLEMSDDNSGVLKEQKNM